MSTKTLQKAHFSVHHLASKNGGRYALNGVHVCDKSLTVTATNGVAMARVQDNDIEKQAEYVESGRILPLEAVKEGLKMTDKTVSYMNYEDKESYFHLSGRKGRTCEKPYISGFYPDANNVMYKDDVEPVAKVRLNSNQVALMMKVLKDFQAKGEIKSFELALYGEDKPVSIKAQNGSETLEGLISSVYNIE